MNFKGSTCWKSTCYIIDFNFRFLGFILLLGTLDERYTIARSTSIFTADSFPSPSPYLKLDIDQVGGSTILEREDSSQSQDSSIAQLSHRPTLSLHTDSMDYISRVIRRTQ